MLNALRICVGKEYYGSLECIRSFELWNETYFVVRNEVSLKDIDGKVRTTPLQNKDGMSYFMRL